jgi:nicotinamidase-related amidase
MGRALLLVDVQRNMLEGANPVPNADRMREVLHFLLTAARTAGAAVVHVQNNGGSDDPDAPGTPGWELMFPPQGPELVVEKTQGDAFHETELAMRLEARGIDDVVIAGMQSEFCIRDTARGALAEGFGVTLVGNGHATYGDSLESAWQIARDVERELAREGVKIATADGIRFG